jgi:uncharacterized membrane protein YgcG
MGSGAGGHPQSLYALLNNDADADVITDIFLTLAGLPQWQPLDTTPPPALDTISQQTLAWAVEQVRYIDVNNRHSAFFVPFLCAALQVAHPYIVHVRALVGQDNWDNAVQRTAFVFTAANITAETVYCDRTAVRPYILPNYQEALLALEDNIRELSNPLADSFMTAGSWFQGELVALFNRIRDRGAGGGGGGDDDGDDGGGGWSQGGGSGRGRGGGRRGRRTARSGRRCALRL